MGRGGDSQVGYLRRAPDLGESVEEVEGATLDRPNWVDLKPWFPHGVSALREAAVREKVAALGTCLWERIQRARRASGVPGNLRRLNPHFLGRGTELRELHQKLALGAVGIVTAVHGLGRAGQDGAGHRLRPRLGRQLPRRPLGAGRREEEGDAPARGRTLR